MELVNDSEVADQYEKGKGGNHITIYFSIANLFPGERDDDDENEKEGNNSS